MEIVHRVVQVRGRNNIRSYGQIRGVADNLQVAGKVAVLRYIHLSGHIEPGKVVLPHHNLPAHALLDWHLAAVERIEGAVRDDLEHASALDSSIGRLCEHTVLARAYGAVCLEVEPYNISVIQGLRQCDGIVLHDDVYAYGLTVIGYTSLLFSVHSLIDISAAYDEVSDRDTINRVVACSVGV